MATQKLFLARNTIISTEREFALFDRSGCAPLNRERTAAVIGRMKSVFEGLSIKTEVVEEVAANAIEVKVCFSTIGRLARDIAKVYEKVAQVIAAESNVLIIGISQPTSWNFPDFTHALSMDLFDHEVRLFGTINSLQAHIGVETEEAAVSLYNAASRMTSILLALSQSSTVDGQVRGRAQFIFDIANGLPSELVLPWKVRNFADFSEGMERARIQVQQRADELSHAEITVLHERYPSFVSPDGKILRWTPDKLFHVGARLRPDKVAPEFGLCGSVELRPIDGQSTMQADLAQLEFALGLLAHYVSIGRDGILTAHDLGDLLPSIAAVGSRGLAGAHWNGVSDVNTALGAAIEGLGIIGIEPNHILEMPLDGGEAQFAEVRGMTPEQIIRLNHDRFMASILG
ncbi:MAG: hypothetical protein Q7S22_05795 [Candidatus Micrarchaeota archaeon]|nr:hypothetical protein [Candidatus Micrarchaeota archaeon]